MIHGIKLFPSRLSTGFYRTKKRSENPYAFPMYSRKYAVFVKNFSLKIAREPSIYKGL